MVAQRTNYPSLELMLSWWFAGEAGQTRGVLVVLTLCFGGARDDSSCVPLVMSWWLSDVADDTLQELVPLPFAYRLGGAADSTLCAQLQLAVTWSLITAEYTVGRDSVAG